jgi:hypothetical protein
MKKSQRPRPSEAWTGYPPGYNWATALVFDPYERPLLYVLKMGDLEGCFRGVGDSWFSGQGFEGIREWIEEIRVKGSGQECPLYTGRGERFDTSGRALDM